MPLILVIPLLVATWGQGEGGTAGISGTWVNMRRIWAVRRRLYENTLGPTVALS